MRSPCLLLAVLVACSGDPGPAPTIQSLSTSGVPRPGGTVTVQVVASSARPLTYAWTVTPAGWTVTAGATADTVTLTAPSAVGSQATARVVVSDGDASATGLVSLTTSGGSAPAIQSLHAVESGGRGQPIVLAVAARDADGDALTYTWTAPSAFTVVSGQGTAQVELRADAFASGLVEIAVSDGGEPARSALFVSAEGGAWNLETTLQGGTESSDTPFVAMNAAGDGMVVWAQNTDGLKIWSRRFSAASGWDIPRQVEAYPNQGRNPRVVVAANGVATAVWEQHDGSRFNIHASVNLGGDWGSAPAIETTNLGSAELPQVAIDGAGNVLAVWSQFDGSEFSVWANRYTVGDGWGTAVPLETDDAGSADLPQIASDPAGNAMVVWTQYTGGRNNIWSNRFAGGAWGTATLVETIDTGAASFPVVAVDPEGRAIAVWTQGEANGRSRIYGNRHVPGTGWGTAVPVGPEDAAADATAPQVGIDATGNALAIWVRADDDGRTLRAARYLVGVGWGPSVLLGRASTRPPRLAVDARGNAIAVWTEGSFTDQVWARRFVPGAGWIAPVPLAATRVDVDLPHVALDGAGNGIAVWLQSLDFAYRVEARRFE